MREVKLRNKGILENFKGTNKKRNSSSYTSPRGGLGVSFRPNLIMFGKGVSEGVMKGSSKEKEREYQALWVGSHRR